MKTKVNEIFLRRKFKLVLNRGSSELSLTHLATVTHNIQQLGFMFSAEVLEILSTFSINELADFYSWIAPQLKKLTGADLVCEPMYTNFPTEVMEMSEAELYLNAIFHYIGDAIGVRIMPRSIKKERLPLLDMTDAKIINLGTMQEFSDMFKNLMNANSSISDTDKKDLNWYIKQATGLNEILPMEVRYKENLTFLAGLVLKHIPEQAGALTRLFKTATDVLRFAVTLSEGDVSLAAVTEFKPFKRSERRFLLDLLEGCKTITEDMLRYKGRWIRLGERLHPGEYRARYPKCMEAFDILRNNRPFATFNSKLESAFKEENLEKAFALLKTRPGELARKLDKLIRMNNNEWEFKTIAQELKKCAPQIATPVLLQVMTHFKHRLDSNQYRTFLPKGSLAKVWVMDNNKEKISRAFCETIVAICSKILYFRFKELPKLGKVYLDENLKDYLVPFSQRSASAGFKTVVRGSKLPIPAGDTVRFFIHWDQNEETGRVDLDLSAVLYDENWGYKGHMSYTHLKSDTYQAYHSGDITSAPNGAQEFIDLNMPSMVRYGARYLVANVLSYTQQPFNTVPNCHVGWMMRQFPKSGEIFEPSTVVNKLDLTADTTICIPVIIDLVEHKIIAVDLALKRSPRWNNVENNMRGISATGLAMTSLVKPNLYDLLKLHALARSEYVVRNKEDADVVFSAEETPYDVDTIIAQYL